MLNLTNSIQILKKYNQPQLDDLVKSNIELRKALQAEYKWGGTKDSDDINKSPDYTVEISVVTASLKEIQNRIQPIMEDLKARYKKSNNLRFVASVITSITGIGLLAAILSNSHNTVVIANAILNIISSVFVLLANNLNRPKMGDTRNTAEIFQKLNDMYADSERLINKLSKFHTGLGRNKDLTGLLEKGEEMAIKLKEYERALKR